MIEAAGHTIQEGVTASDSTCTRDGFTGYTWCSICFAILAEGETLPALGHDYVDHKCARCGQWEYGTPVLSSVENITGGAKVTWQAVSGAPQYQVFRREADVETWSRLGNTTGTTFTDTTVVSGKTYVYTVRVLSQDGAYVSAYDKTGLTILYLSSLKAALSNTAAGNLLVKWTKDAECADYQVQYGTASDFTGAKTVTLAGNTTVSTTLSSLTKGKTCYVRIRTYKKTAKGTAYYSAWSGKKSLKITK